MSATKLWYPHYIEKYRRKTGHLTIAEHGAYRLLMDAYWDRRGPLPADETRMRKLIRADESEWAEVRDAVLEFFTLTERGYVHPVIEENIAEAERQYEAKKERMAKARAARKVNDKTDDNLNDKDNDRTINKLDNQTPSPSPTHGSKEPLYCQFWEEYPHPPNRGSKQKAFEALDLLNDEEITACIAALPAHASAIEKTRKTNKDFQPCMALTFLNERRWEGMEAVNVPRETIDFPLPDDLEAKRCIERLRAKHGYPKLASYLVYDGRCAIERYQDEYLVVAESAVKADFIENRLGGDLRTVLGKYSIVVRPISEAA